MLKQKIMNKTQSCLKSKVKIDYKIFITFFIFYFFNSNYFFSNVSSMNNTYDIEQRFIWLNIPLKYGNKSNTIFILYKILYERFSYKFVCDFNHHQTFLYQLGAKFLINLKRKKNIRFLQWQILKDEWSIWKKKIKIIIKNRLKLIWF